MVSEAASRLLEYCTARAGSSVRSVISYTEAEYRNEYLRDDLRARYTEETLDDVVRVGREIHQIRRRSETDDTPLGRPQAGVRIYENAIVIQIPVSESGGLLATFDPDVGRDLVSFVHECQKRVYEE